MNIEEKANKIIECAKKLPPEANYFGSVDHIKTYANEIIELADATRWRKVEEELPEYSINVLCKYDSGTLFIGYLSKVDNDFRVSNTHYNVIREVIEWKPID